MKAFLPNQMLYLVRGGTIYYESRGGMMASTMLLNFDENKYYMLRPDSNQALEMTYEEKPKDPSMPDFKPTGETEVIEGITCKIYAASIKQNGQSAKVKLWVCEEMFVKGKPYTFKVSKGNGQSASENLMLLSAQRDLKGMLMKMDMGDDAGMVNMQLTCTKLVMGRVDQDKLRLPAGMQVVASTE